MLVLSRKPGQQVHIGTDIIVTVVEIRHGRVIIGFDAPKSVDIAREELVAETRRILDSE